MEQYYEFIRSGDKKDIDPWLKQLDASYYQGKSGLKDENYDNMVKIYESRFGKREIVGSAPTHSVVKLPIAMMSLDKIMTQKELNSFMNKNPGPYIVSDKVNGNAGLFFSANNENHLYNRGDGTEGSDLSHILKYLNLPVSNDDYIKGELVINKKNYQPFSKDYKTNLSMINGLLNSRSADPEKLKLFNFITYDICLSENTRMSETLKKLEKLNFQVPFYQKYDTLTIEELSNLFKKRKEEAEYDVDGLVISADREVTNEERLVRENPKHMVAFKEYGETATAVVERVEWKVSKNMFLNPTIKIHPVEIGDFTIKSLTAFNANWIEENKVGPGTELLITHNTVPYIMAVLNGTEASLPNQWKWKWNETHVDIILLEENDEVRIAKLHEFFKQIDAKFLGESTVIKLYESGFDTVKKLVEVNREDLLKQNIEGLGEGNCDRIVKSISKALEDVSLEVLMSASCVFGIGFGVKKLTLIVDEYPNILFMNPKVEDIVSIKGFAEKTAERFVEGLPKFILFLKDIPMFSRFLFPIEPDKEVESVESAETKIEKNKETSVVSKEMAGTTVNDFLYSDIKSVDTKAVEEPKLKLKIISTKKGKESIEGKTVVFTGFRDKTLENEIKTLGGKVTTSVSKKTTCVVTGGAKGGGTSKEEKALEYGIPVYSLEEFKNYYGL